MMAYKEALKSFCRTLADKSGGGGECLITLEPQEIAGIAIFLKSGQVAVFGGGPDD